MSEQTNDACPAAIRAEIEKRIGAFEYSQTGWGNFAEEVWKLCRRPYPAPVGVMVPDAKVHPEASRDYLQEAYVDGWNECREEVLRLADSNATAAMHALTLLLEDHDRWLSEGVIASVPGTRTETARQAARAVLAGNPQPGAVVGEQAWHDITKLRQYLEEAGHPELGDALMTADSLLRTLATKAKGTQG